MTCANEGAPSAGCQYSYPPGALVTLTANAAPGDVFLGWADACTGEDTTCDVVIDDTFVTATFARPIIVASRIAEKYGDVQERSDGRIQSKNKNLELSRKRIVGLRFPVLGIPQGAKITSAYVQFEADKLESGAVQLFIAAQAHDDAPPFTKARRGVSTRELTSEVVWSPLPWNTVGEAGPAQRAPALCEHRAGGRGAVRLDGRELARSDRSGRRLIEASRGVVRRKTGVRAARSYRVRHHPVDVGAPAIRWGCHARAARLVFDGYRRQPKGPSVAVLYIGVRSMSRS